jgi:hypothetical protein
MDGQAIPGSGCFNYFPMSHSGLVIIIQSSRVHTAHAAVECVREDVSPPNASGKFAAGRWAARATALEYIDWHAVLLRPYYVVPYLLYVPTWAYRHYESCSVAERSHLAEHFAMVAHIHGNFTVIIGGVLVPPGKHLSTRDR